MIKFLTSCWLANRALLLNSEIDAPFPLSNYPIVRVGTNTKQIVSLYADMIVMLDPASATPRIDIVNAKSSRPVVVSASGDLGTYRYEIKDCRGRLVDSGQVALKGLIEIRVANSGLLALERIH